MSSYVSLHRHTAAPRHTQDGRRTVRKEHEESRGKAVAVNGGTEVRNDLQPKRKAKPWLLWLILTILIVSCLSYFAAQRNQNTGSTAATEAVALLTPPAIWDPVLSPAVLFAFDMPELQLPDMTVEARNYREGGREDALSIGTIADPFYLRIVVDRSQQPRNGSFYIDLARAAANAGLSVRRSGQASQYPTKFGAFEMMEITLAKNIDASCLAFRGMGLDSKVALQGWLCGEKRFVEKDMLACFIDRLAATPALRERGLETDLRALDKSRTGACDTAMTRITAN